MATSKIHKRPCLTLTTTTSNSSSNSGSPTIFSILLPAPTDRGRCNMTCTIDLAGRANRTRYSSDAQQELSPTGGVSEMECTDGCSNGRNGRGQLRCCPLPFSLPLPEPGINPSSLTLGKAHFIGACVMHEATQSACFR
mmetsp:Transcript_12146/g.35225  ORF Transcript_12146/g.35225 Transcript_12146/m.35225 type:complete len:139 (+) Transcript_12146:262-678(+)